MLPANIFSSSPLPCLGVDCFSVLALISVEFSVRLSSQAEAEAEAEAVLPYLASGTCSVRQTGDVLPVSLRQVELVVLGQCPVLMHSSCT